MDEAAFLPAEENLPMPISAIPSELFDQILLHLDVLSLERLALTCWKARYLTSRSAKWKRLAESLYIPPAILPQMRTQGELAQRHAGEWRTVMIEEERVRFDGCYISVCHYV
jgi:F-box protein 9